MANEAENKYITVAYKLYVPMNAGEHEMVEEATAEHPFQIISGMGLALDAFEAQIVPLAKGATFDFTLSVDEAYGPYVEEAVQRVPRSVFEIEGRLDSRYIYEGAIVPLMNGDGERFNGTITEIGSKEITVDLNHPFAGKPLHFVGSVTENRPATTEEMDSFWDLPFTKLPHPRYKGKRIPAYDMIKFSVNTHRGCFGGCNFCTIAAHQGKFIQSRSEKSILKEVSALNNLPDFAGNISDVGAPTANMYGMHGKNLELCDKCKRRSCLFPKRCPNLVCDHTRLMELYRRIDATKGIRHSYIGSGIRYDLFLTEDGFVDQSSKPYLQTLVLDHTSGRLKVAPEHTEDHVLQKMAKPSFRLFEHLRKEFDKINREAGTHVGLVPYFISSHPGCTMKDMERLANHPALKGIWMDQVQDFTPTPMTTSSVMYYSGLDPRDMKPVFTERDPERKMKQKSYFFKNSSKKSGKHLQGSKQKPNIAGGKTKPKFK